MKVIILLLIFLLVVEICLAKKEVDLIRVSPCPGYKNYPIICKNVVLTKNKSGKPIAVKFDLVFKKEVKRLMITVTLKKCDSSGNLDTCEYYRKDIKITTICDMLGQKNQLWSEGVSNSNFPRACPIPAGTYNFNNSKLDSDMQLTLLPLPVAFWKIRFFKYDSENENVKLSCTDLDLKVYNVRRYL